MTILMKLIAGNRRTCIIKTLLDKKADPNIQNIYGMTALMYAVGSGLTGKIKLLLEYKADPNIINKQGCVALCKYNYDSDIVKILLQHGANPNKIGCHESARNS